jgi:hypothetical protein
MTTDSGPLAGTTAQHVLDWGKAQSADAVIGVCKDPGECLIAEYARAVLGCTLFISPSSWPSREPEYTDKDGKAYRLSDDLNVLALHFDDLIEDDEEDDPLRFDMHPADLDRLAVQQ